jgi:hypothetical protein
VKLNLGILALALLAGTANADSIWYYTGNSTSDPAVTIPNPCNCALDGTITFADPITGLFTQIDPILSYSFTDGAFTFNNTNSTISLGPATPGDVGLFNSWTLSIQALNGQFGFFSQRYDNFEATDSGSGGLYVQGNKGTWTDPIGTPEPGTVLLLGIAIIGLLIGTYRWGWKGSR